MLLNRTEKEQLVAEMAEKIQTAKTVVLVNYQGLKVKEIHNLKKKLLEVGIHFQIVKNSLFKIVLKKQGIEIPAEILDQPVAVVWGQEDEVTPAKSTVSFTKEAEKLQIIGGIVNNQFADANTIKQLAALPGREELYAKLVGTLNAPLVGLVNVLQGNLRSLVSILDQYNQTRGYNKIRGDKGETMANDNPVQQEEKQAEAEAEVEAKLDLNPSAEENSSVDEVAEVSAAEEEAAGADAEIPAEIAAINTDNETAEEANKE